MPHARRQFGDAGEDLAAAYLSARGYRVIDRNARTPVGELDLVCTQGREVVFVEVKTRRSAAYGHPEAAVTTFKQRHLVHAAAAYRAAHRALAHRPYRIDVIGITNRPGTAPEIVHIPNAVGDVA